MVVAVVAFVVRVVMEFIFDDYHTMNFFIVFVWCEITRTQRNFTWRSHGCVTCWSICNYRCCWSQSCIDGRCSRRIVHDRLGFIADCSSNVRICWVVVRIGTRNISGNIGSNVHDEETQEKTKKHVCWTHLISGIFKIDHNQQVQVLLTMCKACRWFRASTSEKQSNSCA